MALRAAAAAGGPLEAIQIDAAPAEVTVQG
jgi:hypothetical protein